MITKNMALIAITIIIAVPNSSCSTLGVVSDEQSMNINSVIESLKMEGYDKAEEIINSAGDSKWSYYARTKDSRSNLPYIRVQKDKILGTISLQKELIESLRKRCRPDATESTDNYEENITILRTNVRCLRAGAQLLGEKDFIRDKTYKDFFVSVYAPQNTSVMDAPVGEQLPLPINESMHFIITKDIKTSEENIKILEDKLRVKNEEKQESKKCKIAQAAFYTCNLLNQISLLQDQINHERKIGQISGYVNKTALYQAGEALVIAKPLLIQHRNEYKKLTGKNFDASICPKSEYTSERENSELYRNRAEACGID